MRNRAILEGETISSGRRNAFLFVQGEDPDPYDGFGDEGRLPEEEQIHMVISGRGERTIVWTTQSSITSISGVSRSEIDETAWQAYRAGERVPRVFETAWQAYLAGERYPGFVQPFGIGERSVVITTYGSYTPQYRTDPGHTAVDLVPASAYDSPDDINPNTCPWPDWAHNDPVPVYSGITGIVRECTERFLTIQILGDDGLLYFYTHVIARVPCDGRYRVNRGDLIGTLAEPSEDHPEIGVLMHLHLAIQDPDASYDEVNPTSRLDNPIVRDGFGECQPAQE